MNRLARRLGWLEAATGKREAVVVWGNGPVPPGSEGKQIIRVSWMGEDDECPVAKSRGSSKKYSEL